MKCTCSCEEAGSLLGTIVILIALGAFAASNTRQIPTPIAFPQSMSASSTGNQGELSIVTNAVAKADLSGAVPLDLSGTTLIIGGKPVQPEAPGRKPAFKLKLEDVNRRIEQYQLDAKVFNWEPEECLRRIDQFQKELKALEESQN